MRVLFLDFDGVISTNRAYLAQKHIDNRDLRWLDPVACGLIKDLCKEFNLQIVVTSTWRKFGLDRVAACLGMHGLWKFTHTDWRTKDLWAKDGTCRPNEIRDWLARNPECDDWLILDDDEFRWDDEQRRRWVHTHIMDGFSTDNWEQVMNYFKDWEGAYDSLYPDGTIKNPKKPL